MQGSGHRKPTSNGAIANDATVKGAVQVLAEGA